MKPSIKLNPLASTPPSEWAGMKTGDKLWAIYDELRELREDSHQSGTCSGLQDHLKGHKEAKKEFKKDVAIIIGWGITILVFIVDKIL